MSKIVGKRHGFYTSEAWTCPKCGETRRPQVGSSQTAAQIRDRHKCKRGKRGVEAHLAVTDLAVRRGVGLADGSLPADGEPMALGG